MKAHTKKTQAEMTPEKSLNALKEENKRFQTNIRSNRDLVIQMQDTGSG
ncbi:MAG: carbonic anhydrase [Paraglaciecola sp.]|jgi:carbonic anhydrase